MHDHGNRDAGRIRATLSDGIRHFQSRLQYRSGPDHDRRASRHRRLLHYTTRQEAFEGIGVGARDRPQSSAGADVTSNDVAFTSPNVVSLFDRQDKDAAIPDLAGTRSFDDCLDRIVNYLIVNDQLDHNLRQQRDAVLGSAVYRLVTLLPPMAANFSYSHDGDTLFRPGVLHLFQLVWPDDVFDEFNRPCAYIRL